MRSVKIRSAAALAVLALFAAAPATSVGTPAAHVQVAVAAKSCSTGYVHASLSWGEKCLRAGQFCKKGASANHEYHRYGFHCPRSGHLRRR